MVGKKVEKKHIKVFKITIWDLSNKLAAAMKQDEIATLNS